MRPKPLTVRAANFSRRSPEHNTVTLAARATANTLFGGASALVLAPVADRLGVHFVDGVSADEIVRTVYGNSTGHTCERFGAWECPECGCAHVGFQAALECCAVSEDCEPQES